MLWVDFVRKPRAPGPKCPAPKRQGYVLATEVVDRHPSNFKAEKVLQYRRLEQDMDPWPKHVHACEIHIAAQSNASATNLMSSDISGMTSLAMSQQTSGALKKLRDVLVDVFRESLQISYEAPPSGAAAAHREAVYELLLPVTEESPHNQRNALRRYILNHTLNSDIASKDIVHCCGYACCQNEQDTWLKFCNFAVWALIPAKTPKFARNRWLQQVEAVDWCALLGMHHGLLERVLDKWCGGPRTAVPRGDVHELDIFLAPAPISSLPESGARQEQQLEPEEERDADGEPAEGDAARLVRRPAPADHFSFQHGPQPSRVAHVNAQLPGLCVRQCPPDLNPEPSTLKLVRHGNRSNT